jgi:hypothetical protein
VSNKTEKKYIFSFLKLFFPSYLFPMSLARFDLIFVTDHEKNCYFSNSSCQN